MEKRGQKRNFERPFYPRLLPFTRPIFTDLQATPLPTFYHHRRFNPMDPFTADRQIPNSDDIPLHLSPFPDPIELPYSNPMAVIHSPPDIIASGLNPLPPSQKLRPIRYSSRYPPDYRAEDGYFTGTLAKSQTSSQELGFEAHQLCPFTGSASEYFDHSGRVRSDGLTEGNEFENVAGNSWLPANDLEKFGSGMEEWNPSCEERQSKDDSSSSTDDGDDCATNMDEPTDRKRKREARRKLELYLENLVMKVMEKQEKMNKQLIETIERRERERIAQEEAWKEKEIERMKKEEEVRAQEMSRSLALISFIQNFFGHEIEIPDPVYTQFMEDKIGESGIQKVIKVDINSKRWPKTEVQALITLRTALEHKFRITGSKGSIWEEISVEMDKMGYYNRSAKKCREKWENINKYFRQVSGSGKKPSPNGNKHCPYFHELDTLYRSGTVYSGNAYINKNEFELKSENL